MTSSPLSPTRGPTREPSSDASNDVLHSVDFAFHPEEEEQRLAALYRYEILDTPPEEAFDRITSLAADLFDAPLALVSLIDENRQWMKSCVGTDLEEIDLDASICVHAIQHDGVTVIPDTTADERVASNPVVTGEPRIRFYAGAPLTTSDGYRIGTVCVLDTQTRHDVPDAKKQHLVHLAGLVIDELELRREVRVRRQREDELEAARREADDARTRVEEANETMSRFFAGVAHDLQNPLTALLMSANLLAPHVAESGTKYVDRIRSAGERMRVMTSSLMELSRLRSGSLSLSTSPHDVVRIVRDACSTAEDFPEAHGRTVGVSVADDTVVACVDPDALQRVLGNLVGNAFKHTAPSDAVSIDVSRSDDDDADRVTIDVRDTGPGIEPDALDAIFDPFTRGGDGTEGSGLGLAVARDLTEAMGGTLTVDSSVGSGACFRLSFPAAE